MENSVDIKFNLPVAEAEILKELAELRGVGRTVIIREGIRMENFIRRLEDSGGRLLMEINGEIREVLFAGPDGVLNKRKY